MQVGMAVAPNSLARRWSEHENRVGAAWGLKRSIEASPILWR
jgi:hypothetical protein